MRLTGLSTLLTNTFTQLLLSAKPRCLNQSTTLRFTSILTFKTVKHKNLEKAVLNPFFGKATSNTSTSQLMCKTN